MTTQFTTGVKLAQLVGQPDQDKRVASIQVTPRCAGDVWLGVTDGKALAVRRATGEAKTQALCPTTILSKIKRSETITQTKEGEQWESTSGQFRPDNTGVSFPQLYLVLPEIATPQYAVLGLDCKLLLALAEALASPDIEERYLTLFVPLPDNGGIVDSAIPALGPDGDIGAIMPRMSPYDLRLMEQYNTVRAEYATDAAKYNPFAEKETVC